MKLSIENLSFSFHKNIKLLKNLSFEIKSKECLFIEGSNGSGKTTLLRIIAGLQNYSEGIIKITPETKPNKEAFCEFLATEKNGLFYNLSAIENLLFWTKLHKQKTTAPELLEIAKFWGLKSAFCLEKIPIKKFSTGMKRKISLIKLFLSPAPILLLDEPTNGLDIESSQTFLGFLLKAKENGKIIVLSSHHSSNLYKKAIDKTLQL